MLNLLSRLKTYLNLNDLTEAKKYALFRMSFLPGGVSSLKVGFRDLIARKHQACPRFCLAELFTCLGNYLKILQRSD